MQFSYELYETLSGKGNGNGKPHIKERESVHNSCRQYEVKLSRIRIRHTRLIHGHYMSKNNQQSTFGNAAWGNQRLTIKHCLKDYPQWKDSRKKYNIQGDIRTLLGNVCEVEKIMRFLGEKEYLRKYRDDSRLTRSASH